MKNPHDQEGLLQKSQMIQNRATSYTNSLYQHISMQNPNIHVKVYRKEIW